MLSDISSLVVESTVVELDDISWAAGRAKREELYRRKSRTLGLGGSVMLSETAEEQVTREREEALVAMRERAVFFEAINLT